MKDSVWDISFNNRLYDNWENGGVRHCETLSASPNPPVVPQNLPSHISQHMAREVPKLLKEVQELTRQTLSQGSLPHIRVSFFLKMLESKGSQIPCKVLICSQDHPCQGSSLAEEVCSVNCSKAWKSNVLRQKSFVAHIQSNFKCFGQHPHFEVLFIILSRVDHDSSRIAHNSTKPKRS